MTVMQATGRIVAATIEGFEAECFDQGTTPPMGCLVVAVDGLPIVYAVVTSIATIGMDPSRPLIPHGDAGEDLESVLARNPHLPLLLRTSFDARILAFDGHESDEPIRYRLPDSPPRLFARVRACSDPERERFVDGLQFLEPLVTACENNDDVVAAFLRQSSRAKPNPAAFLLDAGRALVPLLSSDPERLTAILRRIRP